MQVIPSYLKRNRWLPATIGSIVLVAGLGTVLVINGDSPDPVGGNSPVSVVVPSNQESQELETPAPDSPNPVPPVQAEPQPEPSPEQPTTPGNNPVDTGPNQQNPSNPGNTEINPIGNDQTQFNPEPNQEVSELTQVRLNQPVEISVRSLRLELSVNSFDCQTLGQLVRQLGQGKTADEIQAAFDQYSQGLYHSGISAEERWELLTILGALEYMGNLKQQLGQVNTATVWQALDDYQECQLDLTAKNIGDDSKFSNGCGLSLDNYVTARVGNDPYEPQYLGEGRACTEAEVPFPSGETTNTRIYFTPPATIIIDSFSLKSDQPGASEIIVDLSASNG